MESQIKELFYKSKKHSRKWEKYFDVYEELFKKYKNKDIKFVEIGVQNGGSLEIWKNYFSKNSKIIGIDLNPECKKFEKDNIQIFIGDQKDPHFLSEIIRKVGKPDIIIDDGGHTSNQQITSFNVLYNHMKDNGTYLVEDTHTSYWQEWQDRPDGLTFMDYAKELSDKLNNWYKNHFLSLKTCEFFEKL